jgi:hypothetical protein
MWINVIIPRNFIFDLSLPFWASLGRRRTTWCGARPRHLAFETGAAAELRVTSVIRGMITPVVPNAGCFIANFGLSVPPEWEDSARQSSAGAFAPTLLIMNEKGFSHFISLR